MPVSGSITNVNSLLSESPNLINSDPYGEGWIIEIEVSDLSSVAEMLDASSYRQFIEG